MDETTTIFFDALGRTVIGSITEQDDKTVTVKNPAVLHAGLNAEGKIQVNLIPVFFREFLKDWNKPILFTYQKATITFDAGETVLDDKLMAQYRSMWVARPPREQVRAAQPVRELTPSVPAPSAVEEPTKLDLFKEVKV